MNYQTAGPSIELSPFIKGYWAMENCNVPPQGHLQRIVPSGLNELLLYSGAPPEIIPENKDYEASTVISGHHKRFYDINIREKFSLFSILFEPAALKIFLNIPQTELYNRHVPLRFFLNHDTNRLEDCIALAKSFPEKVRIAETLFSTLLKQSKDLYTYKRIARAVSCIKQAKGLNSVERLADITCLSTRQFQRTFADYVGATPKQFLRTVRFQSAIHTRSLHPQISLTQLAYHCGYSDQSHFIKEFHDFSGQAPGTFFSGCDSVSDFFC
jgi:AraC-like DNA-binding protein